MIVICKHEQLGVVKEVLEEVFYLSNFKNTFWNYPKEEIGDKLLVYVNLPEYNGEQIYEWDRFDEKMLKERMDEYPEEMFLDLTEM